MDGEIFSVVLAYIHTYIHTHFITEYVCVLEKSSTAAGGDPSTTSLPRYLPRNQLKVIVAIARQARTEYSTIVQCVSVISWVLGGYRWVWWEVGGGGCNCAVHSSIYCIVLFYNKYTVIEEAVIVQYSMYVRRVPSTQA